MIKAIIAAILCSIVFAYEGIPLAQQDKQRQREIHSLKDYKEFEGALQEGYKIGGSSFAYNLGLLYSKDFNLSDANISKDYNKALYYFKKALDDGVDLAAYNIAFIYIANNQPAKALSLLSFTYDKCKKKSVCAILAGEFAGITLDYLRYDKDALQRAKQMLLHSYNDTKLPTLAFYLAYVNLALGDKQNANKWINIACFAHKPSGKLYNLCFRNPDLELVRKR